MIRAVLFDFGGVLAEEGFREGLKAVAVQNGLDPDRFFLRAKALILETGYLLGQNTERAYWNRLRDEFGLRGSESVWRKELLDRFRIRKSMLAWVDEIRGRGIRTAILSDQTNWLSEIEARTPFFHHFDRVFNSYDLHQSKHAPDLFLRVCSEMGIPGRDTVFIDDSEENCENARQAGLHAVRFESEARCRKEVESLLDLRNSDT